ncbi:MAG: DUF1553 domain-containing protein [Gemmataceae bacterium]
MNGKLASSSPQSSRFGRISSLIAGVSFLIFFWLGMRFVFTHYLLQVQQSNVNVFPTTSTPATVPVVSTPSTAKPYPGELVAGGAPLPPVVLLTSTPLKPNPTTQTPQPVHAVVRPPAPKPESTVRVAEERLLMRTTGGDIVLALYPDVAPETTKQFLKWASQGVFDTTHFSRLEPGFVLQTSLAQDRLIPLTEEQTKSLRMLPGEFSKTLKHRKGVISMGREDGKPDSAQTSFSILLGDAPHLDGQYTIFGYIESGMDVVERLTQVAIQPNSNRPEPRLTILHIRPIRESELPLLELEKPVDIEPISNQEYPRSALASAATAILKTHCWNCHGGESTRGDLDLTSAAGFAKGGEHGPVYIKNPVHKSPLLERLTLNSSERMPPKGPRLHPEEIGILNRWLTYGGGIYPPEYFINKDVRRKRDSGNATSKQHWFFQPLARPQLPAVKNRAWVKNEIDAFILAALEEKNLKPVAPASPTVLRRRVSYGLTGLYTSPAPASTESYEQFVEQLLQSNTFGEQMARPWLDVVRFAESDGYEDDSNRPLAYHYRDFVIRAMNSDMPFDQFLQWQIAGDELAMDQPDARAATGFLAAGPFQTFIPSKKDRYDELDDIVCTTFSTFLGMSVGCARCHDHKHDPITQTDYYRLVGIFNGSSRNVEYLNLDLAQQYETRRAPLKLLLDEFKAFKFPIKEKVRAGKVDQLKIEPNEKELLKAQFDPSSSLQINLIHRYDHLLQVSDDEVRQACDSQQLNRWNELSSQIDQLENEYGPAPDKGVVYTGSRIAPAPYLERGDPNREKDKVTPGFLASLAKDGSTKTPISYRAWGRTPRSAMANWLSDPKDGVGHQVARVIVNRVWQHHFGVGLVSTPNDFGTRGSAPSHPQLLDWLANDLIEHGWKLKRLHRMIVTSATYQLDGHATPELRNADPENRLLGRHTVRRLSAEALRDSILAASGNLNREMYGPSIKPPIPAESIFPTAPKHGEVWPANAVDGPANWRRSLYIYTKRSNPVPFLQLFDAPDAAVSCAARQQTSTSTQSLALMNDGTIRNQARLLAKALNEYAAREKQSPVGPAYRAILGRDPSETERSRGMAFLASQEKHVSQNASLEALTDLCHALFMSNEFLFVE